MRWSRDHDAPASTPFAGAEAPVIPEDASGWPAGLRAAAFQLRYCRTCGHDYRPPYDLQGLANGGRSGDDPLTYRRKAWSSNPITRPPTAATAAKAMAIRTRRKTTTARRFRMPARNLTLAGGRLGSNTLR